MPKKYTPSYNIEPLVGDLETDGKDLKILNLRLENGNIKSCYSWPQYYKVLSRLNEMTNKRYIVWFWDLDLLGPFMIGNYGEDIEVLRHPNPDSKNVILRMVWKHLEFRNAQQLAGKKFHDQKEWTDTFSNRTGLDGLYDCIIREKELLGTPGVSKIPLTFTKKARRLLVDNFIKIGTNWDNYSSRYKLNPDGKEYRMLKQANTGPLILCRQKAEGEIYNINSYDINSSYPFIMMTKLFPARSGVYLEAEEANKIYQKKTDFTKCLYVIKVKITNIRLRPDGVPFIKKHEDQGLTAPIKKENDRLVSAQEYIGTVSCLELKEIKEHYEFDKLEVIEMIYYSKLVPFPQEVQDLVKKLYLQKKELKNVDRMKYNDVKLLLNALFGLFYRDPLKYVGSIEELNAINRPGRKSSSAYELRATPFQFGFWIQNYGKARLFELLDKPQFRNSVIYMDTDCVKVKNGGRGDILDAVVDEINKKDAVDWSDIGQWDKEQDNILFKTWGAKQYYFVDNDGKKKLALAGANGEKVLEYLEKENIDLFQVDRVEIPPEYSGSFAKPDVGAGYRINRPKSYSIGTEYSGVDWYRANQYFLQRKDDLL